MDDDIRHADAAYFSTLAYNDDNLTLDELLSQYLSYGMEYKDAIRLARQNIQEQDMRRLDQSYQRSINYDNQYLDSAITKRFAQASAAKHALAEQTAKSEEDREFIQSKMNDLEPFLMVLSRTDKGLHDILMNFVMDAEKISMEDPDEKIRKELRKTRPGKTEKGALVIDQYFMDPIEMYDDVYGGRKLRKSSKSKQRKSRKSKQRKSRKHRR